MKFYLFAGIGIFVFAASACKRIQVATIDVPFDMAFNFPVVSDVRSFTYETTISATDFSQFNDNKERLQTLSLERVSVRTDEVRMGEGTKIELRIFVADTNRNYRLLADVPSFELRATGQEFEIPIDRDGKRNMEQWIRDAPHKLAFKVSGTASSVPFDALVRMSLRVVQKIKVFV